jgi:translation initiation factor eIF-2B subunit alpha
MDLSGIHSSETEAEGQLAEVVRVMQELMQDKSNNMAVCAIKALSSVIKNSLATTMMELEIELKASTDMLLQSNASSTSLSAVCELFSRYVTRTSFDVPEFTKCKAKIIERGEEFGKQSANIKQYISTLVYRFLGNNKVVLIHGFSSVVIGALLHAAKLGRHFSVVTTEGRPDGQGYGAAKALMDAGIPVTMIPDSAVAFMMEKVDFVLVGADGVVESGGVINKTGTCQIAMVAKACKRPFYVAAESYKFARLYPLSQSDLKEQKTDYMTFQPLKCTQYEAPEGLDYENPSNDYTPPDYITLLFTDLGILTPSAVSDELIKLYL